MKTYYAKEYVRGRWNIVTPNGGLVYDADDDKPLVFTDEDKAIEFARRCNENEE